MDGQYTSRRHRVLRLVSACQSVQNLPARARRRVEQNVHQGSCHVLRAKVPATTLDGQTYYASQYFHAQERANSPHGGKYRRHKNFLQALRAIPAYAVYVEQRDIIELVWDSNNVLAENLSQYKPIFAAAGYRPLPEGLVSASPLVVRHILLVARAF